MVDGAHRQRLAQGQRQELRLEARLLESLEILALPSAELAAHLRDSWAGNEALCLEERAPPPFPPERRRARIADADAHAEWLANLPAPERDWRERLTEQAPGSCDAGWFALLVEALDDDGLLRATDEVLLAEAATRGLPGGEAALGCALGALQSLEPRGIGARDRVEVLLLQLDPRDADYPLLCRLVEEHLGDLSRNLLPRIARRLGIDVQEVERLRGRLAELDPAPALSLSAPAAEVLRPELRVAWDGSGFELVVDGDGLPAVTLDPAIVEMARDRSQPRDVRARLARSVGEARALLAALEQRSDTLRRVASIVFTRQRAFLEGGPSQLVALQQREVANELGLHPSTISRAIAGKSVETPWGVFPLREFFQGAGPGGTGTALDLRRRLAAAVEGEDPASPLTDDELSRRLAEDGQPLARRTVAKLRASLGIPSSYRRRRFAA